MTMYYTGVGSRKLTFDAKKLITDHAKYLKGLDIHCRTGNASGADFLFYINSKKVTSYSPKDVEFGDWTEEEVQKHVPSDRRGFRNWKPFVKKLLMRNMKQVLGDDGQSPSLFLVCWAPSLIYTDSSAGGTGWAIRCALAHDIPVFNLYDTKNLEHMKTQMEAIIMKAAL